MSNEYDGFMSFNLKRIHKIKTILVIKRNGSFHVMLWFVIDKIEMHTRGDIFELKNEWMSERALDEEAIKLNLEHEK